MTPKEKAQDLILKMSFETHKHNAKHCAWTAADEIKETFKSDTEVKRALAHYLKDHEEDDEEEDDSWEEDDEY